MLGVDCGEFNTLGWLHLHHEMVPSQVRFSVTGKTVVASVAHIGASGTIGDDMPALKAWMDFKGVERAGRPFCLFFDNPRETPEEEPRSEACIPILRPFLPEGKFRTKELPETAVAEMKHEGSPDEFYLTYELFLESLINGVYRILGPAREYYTAMTEVKGPRTSFLIQQPIAKE